MLASDAVPVASRPSFPSGYGISAGDEGMLEWDWAEERLRKARSYWVSTTRPDGRPHAVPVWGLWIDGAFVFGTSRSSRKAMNLARSPQVVVHLESGDEVVILEGAVARISDTGRLHALDRPYSEKYDFESDLAAEGSVTYELRPTHALAWTESDYPRTATRFDF